MTFSAIETHGMQAVAATVTSDTLVVALADGRTVTVPIYWYPRLMHATEFERVNLCFVAYGEGIHWPDLDEDISVFSLLAGRGSMETQASLQRWLKNREPTS
jgi:hypothetical protein